MRDYPDNEPYRYSTCCMIIESCLTQMRVRADGGASAGAALAPIGSDVRRRPGAHSLYYYGAAPAWPPAAPAPAPAPAAPAPPATPAPPAPGQYLPRVIDPALGWNEGFYFMLRSFSFIALDRFVRFAAPRRGERDVHRYGFFIFA